MKAVIHCEPRIAWQSTRARHFSEGLHSLGVECLITDSRQRQDGLPILLGTTAWRGIESDGGDFLLVDRCSFGDTDVFTQLVRNGHGRRGNHRVPSVDACRWETYGVPLLPWRSEPGKTVLCGQVESYSPTWPDLEAWYSDCRPHVNSFRPHPAGSSDKTLPTIRKSENVAQAVTLNSSIGVQMVMNGIPTVTMDAQSMAWDVTTHALGHFDEFDRDEWAHWLAWTQWTDDEIKEGIPWAHLL